MCLLLLIDLAIIVILSAVAMLMICLPAVSLAACFTQAIPSDLEITEGSF